MGVLSALPYSYSATDLLRTLAAGSESERPETRDPFNTGSKQEVEATVEDQTKDATAEPMVVDIEDQADEMNESGSVGREESYQSCDSSVESESELDQGAVASRLKVLSKIEERLNRFEYKVNHARERYEGLLIKLVVYVWTSRANVQLKKPFDPLAASKHRTALGVVVESLMKLLCELDQVQSQGNAEIKSKRRSLVRKINNQVLPKADVEFSKATNLAAFATKVYQTSLRQSNPSKRQQNPESSKPKQEESSEKVAESTEQKQVQEPSDMEVEENPKTVSTTKPRKQPLNFKTSETNSAYVVDLVLPRHEKIKNIQFSLDSESEMTIRGKTFSLPVEVNPRNANLDQATYELLDNRTIQVKIPKRKRRVVQPLHRRQRYDPFARVNNRPMVWGW